MANLKGLKPLVVRMMNQFLTEAKKQGINLIVTQAFRSKEEQDALYAIGRTIKGNKVTNAKGGQSMHNFGIAIDIVSVEGGKAIWNCDWNKIAKIGKSVGFSWGGDWSSFSDKPHFQCLIGYSEANIMSNKVDWKKFA